MLRIELDTIRLLRELCVQSSGSPGGKQTIGSPTPIIRRAGGKGVGLA